ncbi:Rpn family recombination-promoting nuclease/putative transposase [Limnospira fusiformis]|uniref:Rpn family recombination-promoting nuclease/putative transposase n=1 Tax=Limnospira fusiformis TaxID=54297 RepID=UPI001448BB7B|nr:Rpn family recombination-promoting nuclease/putative transposase [Limnospira fusiformis SAG 85.79]
MFDNVCKFLAETFPADLAQWLLGEPIPLTELSPSELSLEPIRADSLILLKSEGVILHLEFQTQPDPTIPFRMLDYWVRVYRRFPECSMQQVVIYLRESSSDLVYQTQLEIAQTRHQFQVIRLWEESVDTFINVPGLLPFAVLAQTGDRQKLLEQVAAKIDAIADRRTQNNVAASTAILAGLVLDKVLIKRLLRQEIMQESVIYQDIWEEALEKGLQQGLQQGVTEGEKTLIFRLLNRRLGSLPETVIGQINQLPLPALEELGEALLDFSEIDDLLGWLERHQPE